MKFSKIILPVISLLILSCTIVPPRINVATNRTAIEAQLLGDFIGESEFGNFNETSYYNFLSTYQIKESHKFQQQFDSLSMLIDLRLLIQNEIHSLKSSDVVGEASDAMLKIVETQAANKRANEVVKIENMIRRFIINFLSETTGEDAENISQLYYQFNVYSLSPKFLYEDNRGRWTRKR